MTADIRSAAFGGTRNPKQILADSLGEAAKIEAVLVCAKYSDGTVRYAWSDGDMLTLIGLAASAVHDLSAQSSEN